MRHPSDMHHCPLCRFSEEGKSMDFEALCEKMVGKKVRIRFKDGGAPIVGKCIGYT